VRAAVLVGSIKGALSKQTSARPERKSGGAFLPYNILAQLKSLFLIIL